MQDLKVPIIVSTIFGIVILFGFSWSLFHLVKHIRENVLWSQVTVPVARRIQNELPVYTFQIEGLTFSTIRLPDSIPDQRLVTFVFPPGEPQNFRIQKEYDPFFNSLIFLFICGVSYFVFSGINSAIKESAKKELMTTGHKVNIPVEAFTVSETGKYYYLKGTWTDQASGKTYQIRSRPYSFNPTKTISKSGEVAVYFDFKDASRYYIDLNQPVRMLTEKQKEGIAKDSRKTGWYVTGFATIVILGCLPGLYTEKHLRFTGIKANARVVNFSYSRSSSGAGGYFPIVQFHDASGKLVRTKIPSGSDPPFYEIGDEVEVYYDPEDLNRITTDSFKDAAVIWIFLSVGIILLVFGIRLLFS